MGFSNSSLSRRNFGALLLGGAAACAVEARPGSGFPDGLPRSSPESRGIDPNAILAFLDDLAANGIEQHGFMLARGGAVVAEGWWWPYRADRLHMLHSATKSFAVSGVALAMAEGRFGLDDKVISFFPDMLPDRVSDNLAEMRVRDLLTMQSGHKEEISGALWRPIRTSWVAEFLKVPVVHKPGTTFVYSSASSFMLSAIVTRTTGMGLHDYMRPRFFAPLGMDGIAWDLAPGGINPGGNGLSCHTADLLKLGLLYNQQGVWRGKRILPEGWAREATTPKVPSGRYGYQWWIGPADAYYALGLFGQVSIVFPHHDAVLAMFDAVDSGSRMLPLIWRQFPAAFGAQRPATTAERALASRLAKLRLLPPLRPSSSPWVAKVSGRVFRVAPNDQGVESFSFDFARDRCRFTLRDERGEHRVEVGLRDWVEGRTTMTGNRLHHEYQPDSMTVVAGGEWTAPDRFEMTWQFVESVFRDTVICRFDESGVTLERSVNVNSAAKSLATLHGSAAG